MSLITAPLQHVTIQLDSGSTHQRIVLPPTVPSELATQIPENAFPFPNHVTILTIALKIFATPKMEAVTILPSIWSLFKDPTLA